MNTRNRVQIINKYTKVLVYYKNIIKNSKWFWLEKNSFLHIYCN